MCGFDLNERDSTGALLPELSSASGAAIDEGSGSLSEVGVEEGQGKVLCHGLGMVDFEDFAENAKNDTELKERFIAFIKNGMCCECHKEYSVSEEAALEVSSYEPLDATEFMEHADYAPVRRILKELKKWQDKFRSLTADKVAIEIEWKRSCIVGNFYSMEKACEKYPTGFPAVLTGIPGSNSRVCKCRKPGCSCGNPNCGSSQPARCNCLAHINALMGRYKGKGAEVLDARKLMRHSIDKLNLQANRELAVLDGVTPMPERQLAKGNLKQIDLLAEFVRDLLDDGYDEMLYGEAYPLLPPQMPTRLVLPTEVPDAIVQRVEEHLYNKRCPFKSQMSSTA